MENIISLSKTKLKEIKKLRLKKYRDLEDKFLIEGEHLINEAKNAEIELDIYDISGLSKNDIKEISDLESPANLIAVCSKKENNNLSGKRFLLLDEIQDPGNLGTIIRSALAFNIDTIVLGNNCCDLYNEKVIRATQGALFHLNIINRDLFSCVKELKEKNIPVYGTNVESGVELQTMKKEKTYAVMMGNEGKGLKKELQDLCDKNIYIKANKKLESLNVAMATTIILYEFDKEN